MAANLILLVDVDDLVDGDVEEDDERLPRVLRRPHALLVVGHEVLGEAVLVLARQARRDRQGWKKRKRARKVS